MGRRQIPISLATQYRRLILQLPNLGGAVCFQSPELSPCVSPESHPSPWRDPEPQHPSMPGSSMDPSVEMARSLELGEKGAQTQ